MKLQRSLDIKATAEKIWPFLVEPENIVKWCTPINTIRYTGLQRGGLQTTFYFEEKAVGQIMKLHFVVTEWVPNRSVAFKLTSGNLVKSYTQRYTIETIPSGSCITCFEEVTLPFGFIGKFAGLIRKITSNRLLEKMLSNLKHEVEK
ncbi:MAG: SRPBCC family protein [Dehalococcoidales bacterium]|nr:SRPBCC family protein [Dehalococcoidales bacterium]